MLDDVLSPSSLAGHISSRKLVPCASGPTPKSVGERLAEVGKGAPRAEVDACAEPRRPVSRSGTYSRE